MALWHTHPRADLLRHLEGGLGADDAKRVEEHLARCTECKDYLGFVKRFNQALGEATEEECASTEPCPDSDTLVAYEAGEVDEETARHLRAHLLFCDDCAEEFYALRRVSREASWAERWEKLKEFVIDLAKTYGPEAFVGSVKIAGEQLAVARRGEGGAEGISKVLELAVGENTYSIELGVTADGSLSCNIAGYRTPRSGPVEVSVVSESGEEFFAIETDEHGNAQFTLKREEVPSDICVLVLALGGSEGYLPFEFPKHP